MSALIDAVVIVAVVAFVLYRQLRTRRLDADARRWWLLPALLAVAALREPHLVDGAHRATSLALLVVEVLAGAGTGAAWGWTARIWADDSGTMWARAAKSTAWAWAGGLVLQGAVRGLDAALHLRPGEGAVLLSLAASLLSRSGIMVWRARGLRSGAPAGPDAAGFGVDRPAAAREEPTRQ